MNLDERRCIGCGKCLRNEICYMKALSLCHSKTWINQDWCKDCGRWVEFVSHEAIELTISGSAFFKKAIERIRRFIDIEGN